MIGPFPRSLRAIAVCLFAGWVGATGVDYASAEQGHSQKAVIGQYVLMKAARYCAETVGVFTAADIVEIEAFAKRVTDESGMTEAELNEIWQKASTYFDGLRATALDTSFASRKQYCERMSMLRLMLLRGGPERNPFSGAN